ncbi:MAG: hypothetical protein IPK58_22235 [Acidobacteria bacterium]|nr:hypothetical protein [Acidobacteriota bacterium]
MIDNLLKRLAACPEAREWAKGKTWTEIYSTCERGDWLLWLFVRTNPRNKRLRTLAAGRCANTVRHLMTDPRSLAIADAAIAYGEGRIGIAALHKAREESSAATAAAVAVARAAEAARAPEWDSVEWAAAAAAWAAEAPAWDSVEWAAATNAAVETAIAVEWAAARESADAAWAARKANQRETADIVRSLIPIEKWKVTDEKEVAK